MAHLNAGPAIPSGGVADRAHLSKGLALCAVPAGRRATEFEQAITLPGDERVISR
jgi:hypothetical protein